MSSSTLNLIESHRINKGEQRIYEHYSNALNCTMRFAVYLPREALAGRECPTLYYLSGLTCTEQNVIQKSGFQRFARRYDMIVVCPDTSPRGEGVPNDEKYWLGQGAGFYVNATEQPWSEHYNMYDYVSEELPDIIAANFPVNGKQSITGHSMGGYGALLIGLTKPENYCSISAFSPLCSPSNSRWGKEVLKEYFGNDELRWKSVDPCELVRASTQYLPILIDQGTADEFLVDDLKTELFELACQEAGYPCEINMREGYDHSYYFVQSYIMEHFVFHAEYLDAN